MPDPLPEAQPAAPTPRNVFVISSGRTGTTAFVAACKHLPNYSASHESRVTEPFATRVTYPDHHIEADNRLLFFLPQLEQRFGDNALYVYMVRDAEKVAASYAKRWFLTISVVRAYTHGLRMIPRINRAQRMDACRDFVAYADATFRLFLSRQRHVVFFDIEHAQRDFAAFAKHLGIDPVPEQARAQWQQIHNQNAKPSLLIALKTWVRMIFP